MMLPLLTEEWLEFGIGRALRTQLRQSVSLRPLYTFFLERSKCYAFDLSVSLGSAKYIATGRSAMALSSESNFTTVFKLCAASSTPSAASTSTPLPSRSPPPHLATPCAGTRARTSTTRRRWGCCCSRGRSSHTSRRPPPPV